MRKTEELEFKEDSIDIIGKKNTIQLTPTGFKTIPRSQIIGNTLKYLRKTMGFTQKEIAKKIGIAQQTYAGYEKGNHEPSVEIMIRLADTYNTSMDYITGRYIGTNDDKDLEEQIEMYEILEETREHYAIQRLNDKEFMKMIKKKGLIKE